MPNPNDGVIAGYANAINKTAPAGDTMAGPLYLSNQSAAPTAPSGSAVMYATGGVLTYINPQGLTNTMVGSQGGLLTAGIVTVSTTASETVLQSFPLPAADAIPGAVYRMVAWGTYGDTGTPTLAFGLRLGGVAGTSLTTIPAITLGSSVTGVPWSYDIMVNFLSATTVQPVFSLDFGTSAASGATSLFTGTPTGAVTVSLATAKVLCTTVTFSASSASNTISMLGGYTERVA